MNIGSERVRVTNPKKPSEIEDEETGNSADGKVWAKFV